MTASGRAPSRSYSTASFALPAAFWVSKVVTPNIEQTSCMEVQLHDHRPAARPAGPPHRQPRLASAGRRAHWRRVETPRRCSL